ncbi:MAG: ribonuclease E/G, partial [Herbaspirillum sp.]
AAAIAVASDSISEPAPASATALVVAIAAPETRQQIDQPVAIPTPASPVSSAATTDLRDVLDKAGLTLAATDPEKMRLAQEAAAQIAPPARAPRTRRKVAAAADEPLVQIETQP